MNYNSNFFTLLWRHRPPHATKLAAIVVLTMAVLIKGAAAGDFTPEEKIEFLKMGLLLNGGDTTHWGPVDLTRWSDPPQLKPVKTIPVPVDPATAEPAANKVKVVDVKPAADICRRHGMRRVASGKSWRCRR